MKQADLKARQRLAEVANDVPTEVQIPDTKKVIRLRGVKPYTLEKITELWLKRDSMGALEDSASTLKSMCSEPYFAVKEALYFTLNGWLKINLFHRFLTFWWGKVKGYTDDQMLPIILEGKKKLPLTAHWMIMAYSADMRMNIVKMTKKEAEEYRAELLSAARQLSSRSTLATEEQRDSSLG
jgi:hypothetical protein